MTPKIIRQARPWIRGTGKWVKVTILLLLNQVLSSYNFFLFKENKINRLAYVHEDDISNQCKQINENKVTDQTHQCTQFSK